MKKLLYLIPLLLLILCATSFSLYKQPVYYGTSLDTLSPSHWRAIEMNISFSANLDATNATTKNQDNSAAQAVSEGANYKGFPVGAYFSRTSSSSSPGATGSYKASAWSWLWASLDIALIVVTLIVAIFINRRGVVDKSGS